MGKRKVVNKIEAYSGMYINSVRDKVIDSYMEDGETKEMAQYIVDYFEYIYGL